MAGASSDPGGYYYIAATMAAAGGTEAICRSALTMFVTSK